MANKELYKRIVAENQQFVKTIRFFERDYSFDEGLNYVVVGLRRAGKSYLLYQQIHHFLKAGHDIDEILYFNFEDDRLVEMTLADLDDIKTAFEEMYTVRPIFFLDEIQIVDGWEKFARRLADRGYRVYVTGSNAKMLSSEIATTLGGRYSVMEVYPLTFKEYLRSDGIEINSPNAIYRNDIEISRGLVQYFQYGGLPEVRERQDKRAWTSGLFNKIFFGDLVSRYQVRNDYALKLLVRKLAESVKQPMSYNRMATIVSTAGKKISTDTVITYIEYMKESWLLLPMENICSKLADRVSNRKYYFIDNGILNLFLTDPDTSLLENMVAVQLYKRYGEGVFFYNDNVEVDFYIPDIQTAIQVCYSLGDGVTLQRETDALLKMGNRLPIKEKIIITRDESRTLDDAGITVVSLRDWLLSL